MDNIVYPIQNRLLSALKLCSWQTIGVLSEHAGNNPLWAVKATD